MDENVQESMELPEPATLFGAAEQDVLLVFRLTASEKPFTAVTVIVEMPAEPAFTLTFVGFPAMAKSWTRYVIMTE